MFLMTDVIYIYSPDLCCKLATATKQATRSEDHLSAEEHQLQMIDLDNKNPVLKKSINKLDNDITAHQERLQLLQDELERLMWKTQFNLETVTLRMLTHLKFMILRGTVCNLLDSIISVFSCYFIDSWVLHSWKIQMATTCEHLSVSECTKAEFNTCLVLTIYILFNS